MCVRKLILLCVVAAVLFAHLFASGSCALGANLLTNGDFSAGADSWNFVDNCWTTFGYNDYWITDGQAYVHSNRVGDGGEGYLVQSLDHPILPTYFSVDYEEMLSHTCGSIFMGLTPDGDVWPVVCPDYRVGGNDLNPNYAYLNLPGGVWEDFAHNDTSFEEGTLEVIFDYDAMEATATVTCSSGTHSAVLPISSREAMVMTAVYVGAINNCSDGRDDYEGRFDNVVVEGLPYDCPPPFADGFENISVGNYPAGNGWQMMFSGVSAYVSDDVAYSGAHSFRLQSQTGWARHDYIQLCEVPDCLVYEGALNIPPVGQQEAAIGFLTAHGNQGPAWNYIRIDGALGIVRFIGTDVTVVSDYVPGTWCKVRVALDYAALTADVWVDDVKVADDLGILPKEFDWGSYGHIVLDKFGVVAGGTATVAYFDDVGIQEGSLVSPVFEPPIVNSGFALKDGSTVPIKFHLLDCAGETIAEQLNITLEVTGPNSLGVETTYTFSLGDGSLKFDDAVSPPHYVANLSTKTYSVLDGGTYVAEVKQDGDAIGSIGFQVSTSAGTCRGNKPS
jgi:hypothetical protein